MKAPTGKELANFLVFAERIAEEKQNNAAFSGSWGDGGASVLRNLIHTWHSGLEGKLPDSLEDLYKQYQNSIDPEYKRYMELKKKFED